MRWLGSGPRRPSPTRPSPRCVPGSTDGPTEREFGLELDLAIRRLGASGNSFETIVASGPNGAMPHPRPADRRIVEGDLVVLDFGAMVDGYCSDMTRTIMVGESTPTQDRMLEVVLESPGRRRRRGARRGGREATSTPPAGP